MSRPLRILHVEDDPADAELIMRRLKKAGFAPVADRVETEAEFLSALANEPDIVLSDFTMPGFCGLRALELLNEHGREIPFMLVSGTIGEELAVDAMKHGATDYLIKDRLGRLGAAVTQALAQTVLRRDRQRVQEALQESEERFRQLAENIREVFYIVDPERRELLYVSPGYETIWARPLASLSSPQEWLESVHPEDRARVQDAVEHKQLLGTFDEEYRILRPDGTIRWIHDRAFPVRGADGAIHRLVGVAGDITGRKRAEDAIREQAELLNRAKDAIMVRDLDGCIQFWNRGAETIYGWTAAEAMGKCAKELLNNDYERYEMAKAVLLEKGEWTGELRHTRKGGAAVTVDSRWTLLRHDNGEPKSILVINSDVTEHRRLESQFLRAQRLESIGTLASGVAHDLNNILAPILMAAPVLRNELPREVRDQILETIELSAQRGADIVRQVLTFARGVEGERLLIDPTHLVKEIAKIAQETFPKSIDIVAHYQPRVWAVEGDPTQLHQVLLNLCVNARDAMPNGGELVMSIENLPVDESYAAMMPGAKPGPHVTIQVSDTGTGIPRGILDQIFDPFFTTKELGKGTGLGLSTVVGIVKSHGGFINVYSEVGRGTTFKVFLPASADTHTGPAPEEVEPPRGNGELLLLVDDERSIREIARTILQSHGYEVLLAADGPEALAIFALRMAEIKAVLTDIMMPLMDGVTLIRTLRKMKPGIRIIASTGRSDDKRIAELKGLDVPACLNKPYNKMKLLTTLRDTLAGSGR